MHIPKTAGSTMRDALAQGLSAGERLFLYDAADLKGPSSRTGITDLPRSQRALPAVRDGSLLLRPAQRRPATHSLRDDGPGSRSNRVVSHYYHYRAMASCRRGVEPALEQRRIIEGGLSLEKWVFDLQATQTDNQMVRQ